MWMEMAPEQDFFCVEQHAGEDCHGQDQAGPQTLQMAKWERKAMVDYIYLVDKPQ